MEIYRAISREKINYKNIPHLFDKCGEKLYFTWVWRLFWDSEKDDNACGFYNSQGGNHIERQCSMCLPLTVWSCVPDRAFITDQAKISVQMARRAKAMLMSLGNNGDKEEAYTQSH